MNVKLVFFGDSITDAHRNYQTDHVLSSYGVGYVRAIAGILLAEDPLKYQIVNRGVSAHKTVDLYARIKKDVWNEQPDVLTILVGINDLASDIKLHCGVEKERYEKVYRAMIEETLQRFPKLRLILMEPFMLRGTETDAYYEQFLQLRGYAQRVEKLAKEYGADFIPLQSEMESLAMRYGAQTVLSDGVHPTLFGAEKIAEKWLQVYRQRVKNHENI